MLLAVPWRWWPFKDSLWRFKSCGTHRESPTWPPEPGHGEVPLMAAAKTRVAGVCVRAPAQEMLSTAKHLDFLRKAGAPRKSKVGESTKMVPASLHPREDPAGPKCVKAEPGTQAHVLDPRGASPTPSLPVCAPRWAPRVSPCAPSGCSLRLLPSVFKARSCGGFPLRCRP